MARPAGGRSLRARDRPGACGTDRGTRPRSPVVLDAVRRLLDSGRVGHGGIRIRFLGARDPRLGTAIAARALGSIVTLEPEVPWLVPCKRRPRRAPCSSRLDRAMRAVYRIARSRASPSTVRSSSSAWRTTGVRGFPERHPRRRRLPRQPIARRCDRQPPQAPPGVERRSAYRPELTRARNIFAKPAPNALYTRIRPSAALIWRTRDGSTGPSTRPLRLS